MNSEALKALLVRYADGRELCNCQRAYWTNNDGSDKHRNAGLQFCEYGCQTNQIRAVEYVTARALAELEGNDKTVTHPVESNPIAESIHRSIKHVSGSLAHKLKADIVDLLPICIAAILRDANALIVPNTDGDFSEMPAAPFSSYVKELKQ